MDDLQNVQNVLSPIVENISETLTLQDYEILRSYPLYFFELLEANIYIHILQPETKEWIQYRFHRCNPPYSELADDIVFFSGSTRKHKLSYICLSTLVSNYPPHRAVVLFDSMARVNGLPPNPIFQSINGKCLIVPCELKKWPTWENQMFPWLFPPPK